VKRKFKQRWSSIPPISTKRIITFQLTTTTTTYDIRNPCLGSGQTQQYGGVKPFNGIPTIPS
jgi:hypothetical protein